MWQLAQHFNAAHRLVRVVTPGGASGPGAPCVYSLQTAAGAAPLFVPQALDAALRTWNFDADLLEPTLFNAYRGDDGQILGVPVAQAPLAVRWRQDVFTAAGFPAPTRDWTIADFEQACQAVAARIAAGKEPQLLAPLAPLSSDGSSWGVGALPAGWGAFALGYGGSLERDGRFAVDEGAMDGLAELVGLRARYCSPSSTPLWRTDAELAALPERFALALDLWAPPGVSVLADCLAWPPYAPALDFGPSWAWARLPRFTVRPVVTTLVNGEGLTVAPAGDPPHERQLVHAVEAHPALPARGPGAAGGLGRRAGARRPPGPAGLLERPGAGRPGRWRLAQLRRSWRIRACWGGLSPATPAGDGGRRGGLAAPAPNRGRRDREPRNGHRAQTPPARPSSRATAAPWSSAAVAAVRPRLRLLQLGLPGVPGWRSLTPTGRIGPPCTSGSQVYRSWISLVFSPMVIGVPWGDRWGRAG